MMVKVLQIFKEMYLLPCFPLPGEPKPPSEGTLVCSLCVVPPFLHSAPITNPIHACLHVLNQAQKGCWVCNLSIVAFCSTYILLEGSNESVMKVVMKIHHEGLVIH